MLETAEELIETIKEQSPLYCLCHGDIHGLKIIISLINAMLQSPPIGKMGKKSLSGTNRETSRKGRTLKG
jgi:hypothetical protein